MKRRIAMILVLMVLVFTLTACGVSCSLLKANRYFGVYAGWEKK